MDSPGQLAVAGNGDVYVADAGNDRISVFAGDGIFLRSFGEGQMLEPKDVAFGEGGRVYVADFGNDRIDVFSAKGEFLFDFGTGELTDPIAVALGGPEVFVADSGNRIAVFGDGGEFLHSLAMPSPAKDVIVGTEGNLYAIAEEKVFVLTSTGLPVRDFGDEGAGQLNAPTALATDGNGEIFVVDQDEEAVERFDEGGDYLGGFPAGPEPVGVATACAGNVFVVEAGLARVERFGEPGTLAPPCVEAPVIPTLVPLSAPSRLRFNRLKLNRRNGSAVLFVRVSGPGRVILKGRGVRRLARGAAQAKIVRLPVKPKVRLRLFLKQHGKGRIRVEVTFKPFAGGEPRTLEKAIVLRRKR